jgi:hypothetical protein
MASRERTAAHARLVTGRIAARMRSYATATVDQRWQSQLASLDLRLWWGAR